MAWIATAIVGSAAIGGTAAYFGGQAQAGAMEAASNATAASSRYATDVQQRQFQQTREDQEPWRLAGSQALQQIQETPEFEFTAENFEFMKDPGYDFRMQEGVNALDRSAASRGRVLSGAQDRAVTRYGSDLASQEYGNAFNRQRATEGDRFAREKAVFDTNLDTQKSLAGVGQSATNMVSQAGQQAAQNIGNISMQNAQTQGNLAVQGGNAIASTYGGVAQSVNQGIGNYLLYNKTNPLQGPSMQNGSYYSG